MSKARAELMANDDRRGMQETLYLLALPGMRASIRRGLKTPVAACVGKLDWEGHGGQGQRGNRRRRAIRWTGEERMRLALHNLVANHPKLLGHPTDYARFGALALQRAGHSSPVKMEVEHEGFGGVEAQIDWLPQSLDLLGVADPKRITEDGAEAVALCYVKGRLRQGEFADWLLVQHGGGKGSLALEISGTAEGDVRERLVEKRQQVGRCTLPVDERWAVVVGFTAPAIAAGAAGATS